MRTTVFYYISGFGDNEHFTSLVAAKKRAKQIVRDLKREGEKHGKLWIMQLDLQWPVTKAGMIQILDGHGYAHSVSEVLVIEW